MLLCGRSHAFPLQLYDISFRSQTALALRSPQISSMTCSRGECICVCVCVRARAWTRAHLHNICIHHKAIPLYRLMFFRYACVRSLFYANTHTSDFHLDSSFPVWFSNRPHMGAEPIQIISRSAWCLVRPLLWWTGLDSPGQTHTLRCSAAVVIFYRFLLWVIVFLFAPSEKKEDRAPGTLGFVGVHQAVCLYPWCHEECIRSAG